MTTHLQERPGELARASDFPAAFDPFSRLRGEMDDFFSRYMRLAPARAANGDMLVALDVAETEDQYEFVLDVPGVKREDIDVHYEQGRLTVSGERRQEETETKTSFRRSERAFGAFTTSFALPTNVNGDKIHAHLSDGVLTVAVPKSADAKTKVKKIAVKAK